MFDYFLSRCYCCHCCYCLLLLHCQCLPYVVVVVAELAHQFVLPTQKLQ